MIIIFLGIMIVLILWAIGGDIQDGKLGTYNNNNTVNNHYNGEYDVDNEYNGEYEVNNF